MPFFTPQTNPPAPIDGDMAFDVGGRTFMLRGGQIFLNDGSGTGGIAFNADSAEIAFDTMSYVMGDNAGNLGVFATPVMVNGLAALNPTTLSTLAALSPSIGTYADCLDLCNPGESVGSGSGGLVRWNGAFWARVYDGQAATN